MEKIVAAFDGLRYSESTAKYALELAKKTDSLLVGVFLEDFTTIVISSLTWLGARVSRHRR